MTRRHRKPSRPGDRLQCVGFCVILIAALLADGLFATESLAVSALVLLALTVLGGGLIFAGAEREEKWEEVYDERS